MRTFRLLTGGLKPLGLVIAVLVLASLLVVQSRPGQQPQPGPIHEPQVHLDLKHDTSGPIASLTNSDTGSAVADCKGLRCGTSPGAASDDPDDDDKTPEPIPPPLPPPTLSPAGIAVEQTSQGPEPAAPVLDSFDGLGAGFEGPQGKSSFRNPSDNSL